jgi:hypothetical protein
MELMTSVVSTLAEALAGYRRLARERAYYTYSEKKMQECRGGRVMKRENGWARERVDSRRALRTHCTIWHITYISPIFPPSSIQFHIRL